MRTWAPVVGLMATTMLACSSSERGRAPGDPRDVGWAARTEAATLPADVVEVARGRDPRGTAAVDDFRLALGFQRHHPEAADWLRRVALARALADDLATNAASGTAAFGDPASDLVELPTTADELRHWSEKHWLRVDRPAAHRTVHAVVLVDPKASDAEHAAARAVAERIREAVATASSVDEFKRRAAEVPADGASAKVEDLEAVTRDGRVVRLGAKPTAPASHYDVDFAQAAAALEVVGQTSPVVKSAFGYHVLRLVEVLPELRVEEAVRLRLARRDVLDERAGRSLTELLAAARSSTAVEIERSADEATGRVRVE
jgi:hypothetical protein